MRFSVIALLFAASVLASSANAVRLVRRPRRFRPDPNAYYTLVTKFRENENECLEGNKFSPTSTLGGAAFMAPCTNPASGQLWKFIPQGKRFYKMTTLFPENEGKCFEGNKFDPSSTLKGAAFMDNCQNVTGQLWRIKRAGEYFTLTTKFRKRFGECLEGNKFAPTSTLKGAAFMSGCRPFTGQLWKAVRRS